MTPELYPPPPRLLQWVPCPVCNMLFKDRQGRGGHLRHTRDPAHTAYRAQHGLAKPKRSRYPDAALAPPATAPPAMPRDDEITVLDFGEPQHFDVLLEDEPSQPEGALAIPPSPASPAQALRLPSPQAANGYGELSEAGEAPKPGESNASGQAPASAPQATASPSPAPQAMPALPASAASPAPSLPPPSPAFQGKAPASPSPPPASPAQASRLALPEAPIRYAESGEAGEAGRQPASTEARRPEAGAPTPSSRAPALPAQAKAEIPPRPPHATLAAFPSQAKPAPAPLTGVLGALNALLRTPLRPGLTKADRILGVVIVLGFVGLGVYVVVRERKGAKQRAAQPYLIDGSKIVPGAPPKKTGDAYWDRILGYTGDEEP
jgi:hypothetical protein